jgi:hypothetical protein
MRRLRGVREHDTPLWGRMTAPAMVAHVIATMRYALSVPERKESRRRIRPLRWPPVKYAFVYLLRFPKEAPTPSRFLVAPNDRFDRQIDAVERLMDDVAQLARDPNVQLPDHPFFGRLTKHAWGVLGYKHTDHHLRQFKQ